MDAARAVNVAARAALSGLFTWAAAGKLAAPAAFVTDLANYQLLPWSLLAPVVWLVPVLELVLVVALWVPAVRRGAWLCLLVLLLIFSGALASAALRGIDLACGCFGGGSGTSPGWSLLRNAGLLALAVAGVVTERRRAERVRVRMQAG